jgi:hypothetical protein
MRRIFTSTVFVAAFAVISFNSFGQCSQTTNVGSVPGGFTTVSTIANTSSSSFTWTGTSTAGTIQPTSTTVKTPILYYNGSKTNVTVAYDLLSTANGSNTSTVNSYTIQLIQGVGGSNVQSCTGGAFTVSNGAATTYYFTISGVTLAASTNFQIAITFNLSNGTKDITTSNFKSNAFLAGAGAVLPVKFQSLDARTVNSSVSLKWMVATEENLSGYNVERSVDGRNFSNVGFVKASGEGNYTFVDNSPSSITYYRIKSVDVNGKYGYSSIALVKAGKAMIVIKAFPTPFIKNISIQHPTADAGSAITISSQDGRIIKSIIPAAGTQQTEVDLSSTKAGMYLIRYSNANGETETLKILKQQ